VKEWVRGNMTRSDLPIPAAFVEEVRRAQADQQTAKLILLGLEVRGAPWEAAACELLGAASLAVNAGKIWDRVVLFTGHRIDAENRTTPRFPHAMEPVARTAIRQALEERQKRAQGDLLGVSGGANGGDLLFLEVCEELEITSELALALPADQYTKASVDSEDAAWTARFYKQLQRHATVPILASTPELPAWLAFKKGYDIWQRNNLWLLSRALSHRAAHRTFLALWDGEPGDAPGGTEHMVSLAREREVEFVLLNTKQLFGLETRGAAPSSTFP
jgi:hypothetical protein